MQKTTVVGLVSLILLNACGENNNQVSSEQKVNLEEEYSEEEYIPDPYDEYCYVSSENGKYNGECSVRADTNYIGDNMFMRNVRITDNSKLEKVGLDIFSISSFAEDKEPKFELKTYKVIAGHFATKVEKMPEAIFPMDVNVIISSKEISKFHESIRPPYMFNSASLNISKIETRQFDEYEADVNKRLGGENGKQFIEGTMIVNISKLGKGGKDISPLKITFRTDAIWRYKLPKDRTF